MRKWILYLPVFLCCFSISAAYSQDNLPEFGKIGIADLQMTECPFDKSAAAMNLLKTSVISFEPDNNGYYHIVTETRVRIKIFNKNGFSFASIDIPYYSFSKSAKITDVSAVIYNLDDRGKVTSDYVDRKQIFNDKAKSKESLNSIRFTFPTLKAGSVIEYRYIKTDKDIYHIEPWLFQDEIPTIFSKCSFTAPRAVETVFHFVTTKQIDKDSSARNDLMPPTITRSFALHNIPAIKLEPFITSIKDIVQRVEFAITPQSRIFNFLYGETNAKWSIYNNLLVESSYFGYQFISHIDSVSSLIDSVKNIKETAEKINALYKYVKNTVAWDGERTIYSGSVNECLKTKTGNSAEINLLLLNLLRKAGIECYALLVSTRSNGKPDYDFPNLGQFNGVDVLALDGTHIYLLDCLQKNQSFKTPPLNILNRNAFIVDAKQSRWVELTDERPLINSSILINAFIDSNAHLNGVADINYLGVAKTQMLDAGKDDKGDKSKIFFKDEEDDVKVDSIITLHENDDNDTLIKMINFEYNLSNTGDIFFFNPFLMSAFVKNPFTDSTRTADIDFGCNQVYTTTIFLKIPGNFTLEDLPNARFLQMEDSSILFKRDYSLDNRTLVIHNLFTLNKSYFSKTRYTDIKSFFDKVYALISEQIVLKKKE